MKSQSRAFQRIFIEIMFLCLDCGQVSVPGLASRKIKARLMQDIRTIYSSHCEENAEKFNNDAFYKSKIDEAISLKSWAQKKLKLYSKCLVDASGDLVCHEDGSEGLLQRIIDHPIKDFASSNYEDEIITGCFDFPWGGVKNMDALIHLGLWGPTHLNPGQLEKCAKCLYSNDNVRTVRIGSVDEGLVDLELNEAWNTKEIVWESKMIALKGDSRRFFPDTVVLLLSNCCCLTTLSLR